MTTILIASIGDGSATGFADGLDALASVGRGAADATGGTLRWAVPGALADAARNQAGALGVDQADIIGGAGWMPAGSDAAVAALAAYVQQENPSLVLISQTFEGRITAARLAARLGLPVVTNALAIAPADGGYDVTASAFGGDVRAIYSIKAAAAVVTVLPAATGADEGQSRSTTTEEVAASASGAERIEVIEAPQATGPRLEEAKIVVSGGRGLGKVENYALIEALASALGGLPAASRPLVDDGWVDSSRQIGLTGRIAKPDLYLTAGISGASQHMAGCSASRIIVAINRDELAPIFR